MISALVRVCWRLAAGRRPAGPGAAGRERWSRRGFLGASPTAIPARRARPARRQSPMPVQPSTTRGRS